MKNYLSNRIEMSKITTIFAMILVMVGISYYYLINLATDLKWVMMCGYLFVAIPAFFALLHGIFAKRCDIVLLGAEFVLLGTFGFISKIFHGLNILTTYNYFFSAAYALTTVFVFSFADRVAFGKRLFAKWWIAVILVILPVGTAISLFVLPENLINIAIYVKTAVYLLIYLLALGVGVFCIIKKKDSYFSWSYSLYAFLTAAAYVFQLFYLTKWYNLFLMLAVVCVPYVLMSAIKCKE